MAQQTRQNNLQYAGSWEAIYQAYTNINFVASDFNTYKEVMIDYIQLQYPEEFNDWIENSEFVMMIDLLAYLGQNLNYKIDLNAHDNFITTAERQQSILDLAKLVSYYPSRNYSSVGLLKITQVETTQEVVDSVGNSLKGVPVQWADDTNNNWYEQFVLLMNSAFLYNNSFGRPLQQGSVAGVESQIYQFNSAPNNGINVPFSSLVNGQSMTFDSINTEIRDETFVEKTPNPENSMNLIYRKDGNGNSSANTGFFTMFKQGNMGYKDFTFNFPVENRTITIDEKNINETDVWVQQISETTGDVIQEWNAVASTETISYNNLDVIERNIFKIETQKDDTITVKFPDGRFGNIPVGVYRVWYRTSNNLRYRIKIRDMNNISVSIPYKRNDGLNQDETYILTVLLALQEPISNSIPSETLDDIKTRAPAVYYSQDRMVTAQDYNTYPMLSGNIVKKMKSIQRTFAGHSRYIDINDPTGNHQNTNIFAEDGLLYKQYELSMTEELLPTSKSASEIYDSRIVPLIENAALVNFYYGEYPQLTWESSSERVKWKPSDSEAYSMSGYFADETTGDAVALDSNIKSGIMMLMTDGLDDESSTKEVWVKIESISSTYPADRESGLGSVVINESLDSKSSWYVKSYFPLFSTYVTETEKANIIAEIVSENTFGLRWDWETSSWLVVTEQNIDSTNQFSLDNAGDTSDQNLDSSWLVRATWSQSAWNFYGRYLDYIFESENDVRFYFNNYSKTVDSVSGRVVRDYIKLLKVNTQTPESDDALGDDKYWYMVDSFSYEDGYIDPVRVKVSTADLDNDGESENPTLFTDLVPPITNPTADNNNFVFWKKETDESGYSYYIPNNNVETFNTLDEVAGISKECYVIDKGNGESDFFGFTSKESPIIIGEGDDVETRFNYSFGTIMLPFSDILNVYDQGSLNMTTTPYKNDGNGYAWDATTDLSLFTYEYYATFGDFPTVQSQTVIYVDEELANQYRSVPHSSIPYQFELKKAAKVINAYKDDGKGYVWKSDLDIPSFAYRYYDNQLQFPNIGSENVVYVDNELSNQWIYRTTTGWVQAGTVNYTNGHISVLLEEVPATGEVLDCGYIIGTYAEEGEYAVKEGRTGLYFQWRHYVDISQRIDPAPSNIIDNYVLTDQYYQDVLSWTKSVEKGQFPKTPSSYELSQTFSSLKDKKMVSDEMIWHSTTFKLLFGDGAQSELQASFRVVKANGISISDNEIKQDVLTAINSFFDVSNWDFGESFYFTELSTYIHTELGTKIASVVIVPNLEASNFGDLFQIRMGENELPISTATVQQIQIIDSLTSSNIRIGN